MLTVVGAYFVYGAILLGLRQGNLPGPGMMPLVYGSLLVLCSLAVMFKAFRHEEAEREPVRKPIVLVATLIVAVAGFRVAGGVVSLFLMMSILFIVVERRPPLRALFVALVSTALFWLIFVHWLSVSLPRGPWGF